MCCPLLDETPEAIQVVFPFGRLRRNESALWDAKPRFALPVQSASRVEPFVILGSALPRSFSATLIPFRVRFRIIALFDLLLTLGIVAMRRSSGRIDREA
jgi:hypothetical protein